MGSRTEIGQISSARVKNRRDALNLKAMSLNLVWEKNESSPDFIDPLHFACL